MRSGGDTRDAIDFVENVRPMLPSGDPFIDDEPNNDRPRIAMPVVDVFPDRTLPLAVPRDAIERMRPVPPGMSDAARAPLIEHMSQRRLRKPGGICERWKRGDPFEKAHRLPCRATAGRRSRNDPRVNLRLRPGEIDFRENALPRFAGAKLQRKCEACEKHGNQFHPIRKKQDEYRLGFSIFPDLHRARTRLPRFSFPSRPIVADFDAP